MAELSTLARPYAKAAFEYARDNGVLGEWSEQLATVATVAAHERVAARLDNPALNDEQRAAALIELCGDDIGDPLKSFVRVVSANDRFGLLSEISRQFELYKANQEKSVDVEVVSAFDLPQELTDRLADVLGLKLEREVRMSTSTDSDLIGGVLIRAGDTVIDGSVRGRLNKLAEAMNS